MSEKHVMIVENTSSSLKINESLKPGAAKLKLEGKFTEFDIENRNKRKYTAESFIPYMNQLLEKKKSLGILYGEYDHPDVFDVTCKNLSHVIDDLKYNEKSNCIDGKITLLNNSWGKEARSIIEDGYPLFVSSRAAGVTDANGIVHLKELFTYDIVADPGFASARVTPINESLGFKTDDSVQYRIYEMNDGHINALFNDNKNDKKTQMDIAQFEAFLQKELHKFETKLTEKIKSKEYSPADIKDLSMIVESLKEELTGVNKVLEFFRVKMNTLITDNSKLKDDNKKLQNEVSENLMHSNHLTSKMKSLSKYTNQIDERLNLTDGLLEHVANNTKANIYFSKDVANNLAQSTELLEYVAEHVKTNEEALLYVINEQSDLTDFTEHIAKEQSDLTDFTENIANESNKDNIWLNYIHEKVDGIVQYNSKIVESLKSDNSKINESNYKKSKLSKLESIETYLGLDQEQEALTRLTTKIAAVTEDTEGVQEVQPVQVQPVQVQVQPVQVQPVQAQPVQAQPVQAQPVQAQPVQAQPVQYDFDNDLDDNDNDLKDTILNQLVKILSTDETGIVIEITPENKLIIQKSGSDETAEYDHDDIEKFEYTESNVLETVSNVLSEIKKQKALAQKTPHFFNFLSEKQVVDFKQLDNDTQAKIIIEMANKEYYSSSDVLTLIGENLQNNTMTREEHLLSTMPIDIKETWTALEDNLKVATLTESKYFPLVNEYDMINFWNTRSFVKNAKGSEATMIKESINHLNSISGDTNYEEAFLNAFKSLGN
jgi:hypothetical protein